MTRFFHDFNDPENPDGTVSSIFWLGKKVEVGDGAEGCDGVVKSVNFVGGYLGPYIEVRIRPDYKSWRDWKEDV